MTDYYVGCDVEIYQALLGQSKGEGMKRYVALIKKALEECG
jgi:hypothetical protein